jgi:hypothetical protein
MKSTIKGLGIIALIAIIGFAFTACDDSAGSGSAGGDESFVSVGKNPVGGKIYYVFSDSYYEVRKIEFAVSTGTSGTYTAYEAEREENSSRYHLDANGKYIWDIYGIGTYTWNENKKTVTLRYNKIMVDGKLMNKAECKSYVKEWLAPMKEEGGMSQAEFDAYIDEMLNYAFGNQTYTYSFSNDGKALFMQESLPQSKGTDELAGKTYNGTNYDNREYVKDTNKVYLFNSNKTYTYKENNETVETGTYSYDSSFDFDTDKRVYFLKKTIDGKTAAQYYEYLDEVYVEEEINNYNPFDDYNALKMALINGLFECYERSYDPTQRIIRYTH